MIKRNTSSTVWKFIWSIQGGGFGIHWLDSGIKMWIRDSGVDSGGGFRGWIQGMDSGGGFRGLTQGAPSWCMGQHVHGENSPLINHRDAERTSRCTGDSERILAFTWRKRHWGALGRNRGRWRGKLHSEFHSVNSPWNSMGIPKTLTSWNPMRISPIIPFKTPWNSSCNYPQNPTVYTQEKFHSGKKIKNPPSDSGYLRRKSSKRGARTLRLGGSEIKGGNNQHWSKISQKGGKE